MDPMICCQVNVNMTSFVPSPVTGMPATVDAAMEITYQTPNPSGDPYFALSEDSLKVYVSTGTPARVEYNLVNQTGNPDLFYIYGLFFSDASKHVQADIGTFPLVMLAGGVPVQAAIDNATINPNPYTISVVDQNDMTGLWEYTIGIQNLNTGDTGIFDPDIENEQ